LQVYLARLPSNRYNLVVSRSDEAAEQLRTVVGALVRRLRAEVESEPFSWSQARVLKRLDHDGPMTTADLARAERIKPQTMGELVAELEVAELVARKDDAADGRRRLVSLTRAGSRALAEGRAARQSWLARAIESQLDAREQRELVAALDLLRKITEAKE
jgi:DNA-binding MarR family transcriptional regulator